MNAPNLLEHPNNERSRDHAARGDDIGNSPPQPRLIPEKRDKNILLS
jgi:hypothetical protein